MGAQIIIDFLCHRLMDAVHLGQFFHRRFADFAERAKMLQQIFLAFFAHARNIVQHAGQIALAPQTAVIGDGKAVGFILHAGNQQKPLRMVVHRKFLIVIVQTAGAVPVILYHTAHRNFQLQLLQRL